MNLTIPDTAPEFALQDTNGKKKSLSDLKKDKNIVLLFFPLAFSSTCTEELCTMRDNMKIYNSFNATVIAISVDSFYVLKEFKRAQNLNFALFSDFNKIVSKKYGVLYDDYYGMKGVSKRAAFVIHTEGKIMYKEVLEDSGELPNFAGIHQALRSID